MKASKTDPFRQGVTLVVGRTNKKLCLVRGVLAYSLPCLRRSVNIPHISWANRQRMGSSSPCVPATQVRFSKPNELAAKALTHLPIERHNRREDCHIKLKRGEGHKGQTGSQFTLVQRVGCQPSKPTPCERPGLERG